MSALSDVFTSIANAIRTARGESSSTTYKPSNMPSAITPLKYLSTSTTATASDMISGKTTYNSSGNLLTGNVIKYIKGTYTNAFFLPVNAGWSSMCKTSGEKYMLVPDGKSAGDVKTLYTYNKEMTRSTAADFSVVGNPGKASGIIGKYTIYAGGRPTDFTTNQKAVDAYTEDLTRTSATDLTYTIEDLAILPLGNNLIMGAGRNLWSPRVYCYAYSNTLTKTTLSNFTTGRVDSFAASIGKYAIFIGGRSGNGWNGYSTSEVYDIDLTKITSTSLNLSIAKSSTNIGRSGQNSGCPNNITMIIAGGRTSSGYLNNIDIISSSLTYTATSNTLSTTKYKSGTLQNFYGKAIFVGGTNSSGVSTYDAIDVNGTRVLSGTGAGSGEYGDGSSIGIEFNGQGFFSNWSTTTVISPTLSDIKVTS